MAPSPRGPLAARRINDLPGDTLLRVLSHLGARQAVRTCALSRRWRDLWRDVGGINTSSGEFTDDEADEEARGALFNRFLNRLLMLRSPTALDHFRLWYCINLTRIVDD